MQRISKPLILAGVLLLALGLLAGCMPQPPTPADDSRVYREQLSSAIDFTLDIPEVSTNEVLSIPGRIGPGLRVFIEETEMDLDPFGNFVAQVRLTQKKNYIRVRVVSEDGKDIYATSKVVNYNQSANPFLDVVIPATVSARDAKVILTGQTDPDCKVSANGRSAVPDENGNFIVEVPLEIGDNIVKIVATNPKGKTSTAQRVVSYNTPVNMQPMLVVSSPEPSVDGFVSSDRIKVVGFTDPYNIIEIYNNYYNDDGAIKSLIFKGTTPRNGQFSVDVSLSANDGDVNEIQVVATNANGGTATESRRVTYKEPQAVN